MTAAARLLALLANPARHLYPQHRVNEHLVPLDRNAVDDLQTVLAEHAQAPALAIARDLPNLGIEFAVVSLAGALCTAFTVDWNDWRPASAAHRLIEHGYMLDPAARYARTAVAGWTRVPGLGHIAPVHPIHSAADQPHDEPHAAEDNDCWEEVHEAQLDEEQAALDAHYEATGDDLDEDLDDEESPL